MSQWRLFKKIKWQWNDNRNEFCFDFVMFLFLPLQRSEWQQSLTPDHLSRLKYFTMFSSQVSENIFLSLKIFLFEQWFAPGLVGGRAGQGRAVSQHLTRFICQCLLQKWNATQHTRDIRKFSLNKTEKSRVYFPSE